MRDRCIGETVRSIFDLMEFSLEENIPDLMILTSTRPLIA